MSAERDLDQLVEELLADPQHDGHPLRDALARMRERSLEQLHSMERITRISDGFQSMALAERLTLSDRYQKQLQRLGKIARISDRYQEMLRDLNVALREASTHDKLTGLGNRALLMERLGEESSRSLRNDKPYVVAMLDVDHFKRINDTWGHHVGDRVLIEISRTMETGIREYDTCGRWGGEEFLLLLPDTRLDDARPVIERIHHEISVRHLLAGVEQPVPVTASIGVAEFRLDEIFSQTLNRADDALLRAKRDGRNRCVYAQA